ncbi:helix-turn-helix domain-containing protein [Terracidiphilus sp.]|jgi:transposase|uniref:helix-turn-helix domain-containing protein n=1 Tax=Terracidiphilus sp. TaxID=1964191 RepID=UPI003C1FA0CC
MGRAYSDDLRLRILEAYERGEGSCRALAARFGVSWEYVRKVRQQQVRSGHRKRLVQSRFGVRSRVTEQVKAHMLVLVESQADITITELRERLEADKGVPMSWTLVQLWVKRLGLRLKKSRSMQSSGTQKPIANVAPISTAASSRPTRND